MRNKKTIKIFLLTFLIATITTSLTLAQEDSVSSYIEQLNYMEASARAYAAYALGEIGSGQAVESLVPLLSDQDKYVRAIVVEALGKIGGAQASEALVTALQDEERTVRLKAANALEKIDSTEQYKLDIYVKDLNASDASIREKAAKKLAELAPEKAKEYRITRYINDLKDPDVQVRASAASLLGDIGDASTVQPLISALNDNEALVRKNAVTSLGQIYIKLKDATAIKPAIETLVSLLQDESEMVSQAAATTLTELGEPAVEALSSSLQSDNSELRAIALEILGKIKPENKQEYKLTRYINDLKDQKVYVRANAADALGSIYNEQAVIPLIEALKDVDKTVRQNATNSLIKIGEPAISQLIIVMKEQEPAVKLHAAIALKEIGLRLKDNSLLNPAKDVIVEAFINTDSPIHSIAQQILKQIGAYAVDALTPLLNEKDDTKRAMAAAMLAEIEPQKATYYQTTRYINDLDSSDASVRATAATNLGLLGKTKAVGKLVALLSDSDESVRKATANALEQIGAPAIEPLVTLLTDENKITQKYAFVTLAEIAPKAKSDDLQLAIPPAIEALKDVDSSIRSAASNILVNAGESSVRPLIALFKDADTSVYSLAIEILVDIGNPAIEPLKVALNDQNHIVRKNALVALSLIAPINAQQYKVTKYINDLKDADEKIRMRAAFELGRTNDPRAVEPLISALSDANFRVRANAADSLAYLADKRAIKPLKRVEGDDQNKMVRRVAKESLERLKELD